MKSVAPEGVFRGFPRGIDTPVFRSTMSAVRSAAKSRLPSYQDLLDKNALEVGERVFLSERKVAASPLRGHVGARWRAEQEAGVLSMRCAYQGEGAQRHGWFRDKAARPRGKRDVSSC